MNNGIELKYANILSVGAIKFYVMASLIFRGSCKVVSNLEPVTWVFFLEGGGGGGCRSRDISLKGN